MAFRPTAWGNAAPNRRPFGENFFMGAARTVSQDERISKLKAEKEKRKQMLRQSHPISIRPYGAPVTSGSTASLKMLPFSIAPDGITLERCISDEGTDDTGADRVLSGEAVIPTVEALSEVTPRKDLAGIFADDEKTSNLAEMMLALSVKTPSSRGGCIFEGVDSGAPAMTDLAGPACETAEPLEDEKQNPAEFFRGQATAEGTTLEEACLHWTKVAEDERLDEVLRGEIRATVGQALLLHTQRVTQFLGLCDLCDEGPGEDGLTARAADLEGFWEVIMMQVNDVKKHFAKLEKRQKRDWKTDEDEATKCRAPKKARRGEKLKGARVQNKKAGKSQSRKVAARSTMPPTPRRKAAQARLIAAKEQLKKRAQTGAVDAPALGSLPVLTPVRATKKEEKLHGTAFMVTPVRRSGRKTPSKYRKESGGVDVVLKETNFAYKPNFALMAPVEAEESEETPVEAACAFDDEETGEASTDVDPLNLSRIEEDECSLSAAAESLRSITLSEPRRRLGAPLRVPASPAMPMRAAVGESRVAKRGFETAVDTVSAPTKRMATVTPSRLADAVATPVRRSRRLAGTPAQENPNKNPF